MATRAVRFTLHFLAIAALAAAHLFAAESDPAAAIDPQRPLTSDERQKITALFTQAGSNDFDERDKARAGLTAFGPRVIPAAKLFERDADPEIARLAGTMRDHVLLDYAGYLPTQPALQELLEEEHRVFIGKEESFDEVLRRFSRSTGLRVLYKAVKLPESLIIGTQETIEMRLPAGEALQRILAPAGLKAVPRGDTLVVTTQERAAQMFLQTHAFDLSALDAALAKRVANALTAWLPAGAEVKLERDMLRITASEVHIRIAARAIGLFAGKSAAIFPRPPKASAVSNLFETLAKPVSDFQMSGIESTRGIARLQDLGQPVELDKRSSEWATKQRPVSLDLQNLPLGYCLQFLKDRAIAGSNEQRRLPRLQFAIVPDGPRMTASLAAPETTPDLAETVCALDVAFVGAADDAAIEKQIRDALLPELNLLPVNATDCALTVVDRRLIARGSPEWVARLTMQVEHWRQSRTPHAFAWMMEFQRKLDREIDWDGTSIVAGNLIETLRERCGVNIVIGLNEKGNQHAISIESEKASLLPKGKHSARKLLDKLAEIAGCSWTTQWGAVVLERSEKAGPPR